jgi:BSD domain
MSMLGWFKESLEAVDRAVGEAVNGPVSPPVVDSQEGGDDGVHPSSSFSQQNSGVTGLDPSLVEFVAAALAGRPDVFLEFPLDQLKNEDSSSEDEDEDRGETAGKSLLDRRRAAGSTGKTQPGAGSKPVVYAEKGDEYLARDPRRVEHAKAILVALPELSATRRSLVPGKMNDSRFWRVYFALIGPRLPWWGASEARDSRKMMLDRLQRLHGSNPEYFDCGIAPEDDSYFVIGDAICSVIVPAPKQPENLVETAEVPISETDIYQHL